MKISSVKNVVLFALLITHVLLLTGCESSGSLVVYGTGYVATQPTVVVVRPLAISADDAKRDTGVLPAWILSNPRPRFQTSEDLRFGAIAAEAVAKELMNELSYRGIPAVMSDGSRPPAGATIITGQFVELDTGTKWLRPEIGYTVKTGYEARVQILQNNNLAVEMAVYSKSDGEEGAREIAAQVAHQLHASYVIAGWAGAKGE